MGFFSLIIIPFLFGLVGFFEPCSLGINVIFLRRIESFSLKRRLFETTSFTLVRGFFMALVGMSAAFIGSFFVQLQSKLFLFLGGVYILLGVIMIVQMYYPIFKKNITLGTFAKRRNPLTLGIIFGLIIPACAIGFIVALIGNALVMGNLLEGFISLFIFGISLSLPLLFVASSPTSITIIQKIVSKTSLIKWLGGAVLIVIGVLTFFSGNWWQTALA